jgi:hypothetical protein
VNQSENRNGSGEGLLMTIRIENKSIDRIANLSQRIADAMNKLDALPGIEVAINKLADALITPIPDLTVIGGDLTITFPGNISITSKLRKEKEQDMNETFTLPNNTPDLGYSLAPIDEIKDAEGEVITSFTETYESSDPAVMSVNPTDPRNGTMTVGKSGTALVVHSVKVKVGRAEEVSTVDAKTYIVTTGAPLVVTGGGATITGADPDPVEPPVE